jgi:hypothetical protein
MENPLQRNVEGNLVHIILLKLKQLQHCCNSNNFSNNSKSKLSRKRMFLKKRINKRKIQEKRMNSMRSYLSKRMTRMT